jgi:GNAT superfamily N-acetyltransferase
MVRTEPESIGADLVELDPGDVGAALALSVEAGWDQTAEDWALMLRLGRAFGVRAGDRLVASALALPYPPRFGWVSMVLVHEPYRRRGLGTRVFEAAVAALRDRGLVPMLDATPAGEPLYASLGFRAVERLTRWRGRGAGTAPPSGDPLGETELVAVSRLDREAFGADRTAVLADLAARPASVHLLDPAEGAFLLSRPGRTALHLGPLVARSPARAASLLHASLELVCGPVLVDVPDRQQELAALLAAGGFEPERPFARMALGSEEGFGDPELLCAVAGPELG